MMDMNDFLIYILVLLLRGALFFDFLVGVLQWFAYPLKVRPAVFFFLGSDHCSIRYSCYDMILNRFAKGRRKVVFVKCCSQFTIV